MGRQCSPHPAASKWPQIFPNGFRWWFVWARHDTSRRPVARDIDTPARGPNDAWRAEYGVNDTSHDSMPGETALMTASKTGRVGAIYRLLKAGASVNAVDAKKRTALHYVVHWHSTSRSTDCPI